MNFNRLRDAVHWSDEKRLSTEDEIYDYAVSEGINEALASKLANRCPFEKAAHVSGQTPAQGLL